MSIRLKKLSGNTHISRHTPNPAPTRFTPPKKRINTRMIANCCERVFPGSFLKTESGGVRVIDAEFCFGGRSEWDGAVFLAHLVLAQQRTSQRYLPIVHDDELPLTRRIIKLACMYGRYGYRRVTVLLHLNGWFVNQKRVEQIWREQGLKVPMKQRRRGRSWLNDGSSDFTRQYKQYLKAFIDNGLLMSLDASARAEVARYVADIDWPLNSRLAVLLERSEQSTRIPDIIEHAQQKTKS